MRECFNEKVAVLQSEGTDLSSMLRDAADEIEKSDASWHNMHLIPDPSGSGYILTLYVHS